MCEECFLAHGSRDRTAGARAKLDVLLKEAEFLRAEILACIGRVRYLGLFPVIVGGGAFPVLATILMDGASSGTSLQARVEASHVALQAVMLGVAFASAALLNVYLGVFKQIFAAAAYFRHQLIPAVNEALASLGCPEDGRVLGWELWLRNQRANSRHFAGDSDLKAEPYLIAGVGVAYAAGAVITASIAGATTWVSGTVLVLVLGFVVEKFSQFYAVLKAAATD